MENVLDIVYSYSFLNKLLDKKAIEQIIDIVCKLDDIETIEDIRIYTYSHKSLSNKDLATYMEGDIEIYLSKIYNYIHTYTMDYFIDTKTTSKFERCFINNLFILETVLHELEHALQNQYYILEKKDTIEHKLTSVELSHINHINDMYDSNRYEHRRLKDTYQQFYEFSFIERMADIRSKEKVLSMLEKVKDQEQRIYEYEQTLLHFNKICIYRHSSFSPTIKFFMGIGKYVDIKKMNLNNLSYDDRLEYGLTLTQEELFSNKEILRKKRIHY